MKKYDQYSNCRIIGSSIKSAGEILKPLLKNEQELLDAIGSIKSEAELKAWYPMDTILALMELAEKNDFVERMAKSGALNVVRLMRQKGQVHTPEQALKTIEMGFKYQHQGNVGQLSVEIESPTAATVVDSTYGPCGYLSGMIELTIANYGAVNISMTHFSNNCRQHGAPACKYSYSWEESSLLKLRMSEED